MAISVAVVVYAASTNMSDETKYSEVMCMSPLLPCISNLKIILLVVLLL